MPTTANLNITYNWLEDYTEEFGPDDSRIVSMVDTTWTSDNIKFFPQAMMGANSLLGNAIFRDLPELHPAKGRNSAGKPWFACTEVKLVRGIGAWDVSANMIEFIDGGGRDGSGNLIMGYTPQSPRAVWEITWQPLPYDLLGDADTGTNELLRFIERKKKYSVENLPVPGAWLKWTTDNETLKERLTIHFPTVELHYKQFWRPEPLPEATWATKQGQVNTASFDVTGIDADPQTVLFHSWDVQRVRDAAQKKCAHVDFMFLWRPKVQGWNDGGWNAFFRALTSINHVPAFQKIVDVATGTISPYALAGGSDLNGIFGAKG